MMIYNILLQFQRNNEAGVKNADRLTKKMINTIEYVRNNSVSFTGNGTSSSGARRADEMRGLSETGYSYFGARYYDSDLSGLFLSVDPMADKYPSISPYAYCAWNPVKLIDPDGNDIQENDDKWQYNTTTGSLSWIDEKGGLYNQEVDMVHNEGDKTLKDKTVSFSGDISRMFDVSTFSPSIDGVINGTMDIATGINEVGAGLTIGVGLSTFSSGMATPISTAIGGSLFALGGSHIMLGIKDVVSSIEGEAQAGAQQCFMKTACKTGAGFVSSIVMNGRKGFTGAVGSLVLSAGWSYLTWHKATHPTFKGIPQGANVIQH